jgi:hypothetical protein
MDGTLKFVNYKVGGTQNPYSFTETKDFLDFFLWKYFFMHIKPEGLTQFDIFHIFIENSVDSELLFFWALLKAAKIWNSSKNAHVWAA